MMKLQGHQIRLTTFKYVQHIWLWSKSHGLCDQRTDVHTACVVVFVPALRCEIMLRARYFTFTVAEKRWAGRERRSDTIFGTAFTNNSFPLVLWKTSNTPTDAHLGVATASRPHFPVYVLFQLKLWLVGFLHGPVLQFPDRDKKNCDHIGPTGGAITTMILIGWSNGTCELKPAEKKPREHSNRTLNGPLAECRGEEDEWLGKAL